MREETFIIIKIGNTFCSILSLLPFHKIIGVMCIGIGNQRGKNRIETVSLRESWMQ